jgi:cytochrome c oxidase subunit 2
MNHSALATDGPFAQAIAREFWLFIAVSAAVYVLVLAVFVYAVWRKSRGAAARDRAHDSPKVLRAISIAVGTTGVILVALAVSDFFAHRAQAVEFSDALRVRVTAYQWWWDVEYLDPVASQRVRTANELMLPVGRPVQLELRSGDVIHSFWVPNLQGKRDLLPGYTTKLALQASRASGYTGECAEFCGLQHAHMSFDVYSRSPEEFERWRAARLAPAADPETDLERHGRDVFMSSTCTMCHAIAGTDAGARLGPDLTHVASRRSLAAGTLPNNAASLAAWISDPQAIKPGTRMPATKMPAQDLSALTAYLGSLR